MYESIHYWIGYCVFLDHVGNVGLLCGEWWK